MCEYMPGHYMAVTYIVDRESQVALTHIIQSLP